jgi:hypothetical protein
VRGGALNMRISIKKYICEGELIPPGYGVALRDYQCRVTVLYPVPINWIVRYADLLWWKLVVPPNSAKDTLYQKAYQEAWEAGFKSGVAVGRQALENEINAGIKRDRLGAIMRILKDVDA